MKTKIIDTAAFILFISSFLNAQQDTIDYLGQTPPGDSALIFSSNIVSVSDRYEYGLSISPNGKEIFFTAEEPGDGLMRIVNEANIWSSPQHANLRKNDSWEFEAFYTQTGDSLFFTSEDGSKQQFYFVTMTDSGWSESKKLDSPVNDDNVMWCSFSSNGNMYYTKISDFSSYRSKKINGTYQAGVKISDGAHPYVSSDESYFLYNKSGSIYLCFKKHDGESWDSPVKLGNTINSSYNETCPSLSPDEKYMFFSRYNDMGNKCDIYWISTSFIEKLRPTSVIDNKMVYSNIDVFPNPATQNIQISLNSFLASITSYQLVNMSGRIVKHGRFESKEINISGLRKGIYMLNLYIDKELISKKIVIE
jgi:hypothetical protein